MAKFEVTEEEDLGYSDASPREERSGDRTFTRPTSDYQPPRVIGSQPLYHPLTVLRYMSLLDGPSRLHNHRARIAPLFRGSIDHSLALCTTRPLHTITHPLASCRNTVLLFHIVRHVESFLRGYADRFHEKPTGIGVLDLLSRSENTMRNSREYV